MSDTPRTLPEYVKCITDDGQELPMRRCPACKKPSFIGYRCDGCDLAAERERADRNQEDAGAFRSRSVVGWLRGHKFIGLPEESQEGDVPVYVFDAARRKK